MDLLKMLESRDMPQADDRKGQKADVLLGNSAATTLNIARQIKRKEMGKVEEKKGPAKVAEVEKGSSKKVKETVIDSIERKRDQKRLKRQRNRESKFERGQEEAEKKIEEKEEVEEEGEKKPEVKLSRRERGLPKTRSKQKNKKRDTRTFEDKQEKLARKGIQI